MLMKSFRVPDSLFRKSNLLVLGLLHFFISLSGQNENLLLPDIFYPGVIQDNNLVEIKEDTAVIMDLVHYAQALMARGYWLNLDSVKFVLNKAITKSIEADFPMGLIHSYIDLGWAFKYKDIDDSARYYFKKGIELDEEICNDRQIATHYWYYGDAFAGDAMTDSAILMYKKGKELAEARQDTFNIMMCLYKSSTAYSEAGDNLNAFKYAYELYELTKESKDTSDLLYGIRQLYFVYSNLGQQEKAMELLRTSVKLAEGLKYKGPRWRVYYMAMSGYMKEGKYDSVLYYARLNIPIDDMLKRPRMSYQSMSWAFMNLNQWDSACYYMHEFYNQAIQTGQMDATTYLNLGKCAWRSGDKKQALAYYRLAEKNFNSENLSMQRTICQDLYKYFDSTGQTRIALEYLKKFQALDDSIEQNEANFEVGLEMKERESEKLQAQLALMEKDREIQAVLASKQRQQKIMVYVGFGLLLLFIGFGFQRFRKYKEMKSIQALVDERLRISRELHDEVGATLSGIAMYTHVAKEQVRLAKNTEAETSLTYMQKSAGEMVNKLSDIVWLINPEQDTILEIIGRLGEFGKQMAGAKNMQMKLDVPAGLTGLHIPLEARRNIYLICKEAINNAVKYSRGRVVELKVRMAGSQLLFSVHDDGIGFDYLSSKEGNGLVNMQNRAKAISASYELKSMTGQGTQIEFQYDLHS